MFILRFIDEEYDLAVKEYISQNNLEKTWHQIEEVKKVVPNLKQD